MGFKILTTRSSTNELWVEFYSSSLGGGAGTARTGFMTELDTGDTTGGTIKYRLLGQQGTANLTDFLGP